MTPVSVHPLDQSRLLRGIHVTLRLAVISTLILLGLWLLQDVILLAFAAILIACVLRAASAYVGRLTGIGPQWALLPIVLLVLLTACGLLWWRGPVIASQATDIAGQLRGQAERIWSSASDSAWASPLIERFRSADGGWLKGVGGYVTGLASSTLGISTSLLLVLATALFLAISPDTYRRGLLRLMPPAWRDRGDEVLRSLGDTLQLWFLGQLVDMLLVSVLVGIGLYALGVQLAFTLALFAGLLNFIPFIGALVGAVPAVLIALSQSPLQAALVAALFLAVQTFEGNVIAPIIQKRTVALPPALTIFSQTILGTLFGPLGLILATPVMAAMLTLVRMVYVESVLEREASPGEG